MSETKTYDPSEVSVIFGGQIITGFAEGDSIQVTPNVDRVTMKVGAQGHVSRTKSANRSGRATITLQQTAEANAIFQEYLNALEAGREDTAPLLIRDNSGNDLVKAETAWVVNQAAASYGEETGTREWIIESGNLSISLGGN